MSLRVVVVAAAVAFSGAAHASIFDLYGTGARGIALGGAMTAITEDFSAAFYNPAAVTVPDLVTYGGNFQISVPTLDTRLARPVCLDGAAACAGRYGAHGYSAREPSNPATFAGITIGWTIPFESDIGRFALGIALYVPTNNLIRAEALDPVTPQYYYYQNLPDELVILASVGWAPLEWLAVGAGVQVLADVNGSASFAVDVTNHRFDRSDIFVAIEPKMAATAGILIRPTPDLRIGLSYRQELGLSFGLPASVDASGALVIGLTTGGSVLYSPHQLQFGVGYHIAPVGLTLTAELDYAFWSHAPDPSPRVAVTVGGDLLDTLGVTGSLDVGDDAPALDLGFHDIVTSRVGVEWQPLTWFTARAGYSFRPTPAPRATGTYNYLDNDTHSVGFGLGFTFDDPLSVHPKPITVDVGSLFGILPRRTIHKPVGDPVGDLEHGGWTYTFSVSISHRY